MYLPLSDVIVRCRYFSGLMIRKSNAELRQTFQDGVASLSIEKVVPQDAGEYTCAAKNAAGEVRCSCVLNVDAGT